MADEDKDCTGCYRSNSTDKGMCMRVNSRNNWLTQFKNNVKTVILKTHNLKNNIGIYLRNMVHDQWK